jgi:CysZ protein
MLLAKREDSLASSRRLSFGEGFSAVFAGIGFICRPANWGLALVPAIVALGLMLLLGVGFGAAASAFASHLVPGGSIWYHVLLHWITQLVLVVVALAFACLLAFSLAQPLSGFALDGLSRRQERALGGLERPGQSGWTNFLRTLRVTSLGLAAALLLIVPLSLLSLSGALAVVTVPLKMYIAAMCVVWDFLDYPLGLRGMDVRTRLRWCRHNFAAVTGVAIAAGCVLLVPGLGLLLLPAGVAGVTRLVVNSERPLEPR